MQTWIKRLSFFIIYLPALCFGCQMFYYFGLFQVSETTVFALGLNNNEVIYLGANELFVLVVNLLDKIFSFIQTYWVQVFYCTYYPFFIWFWWKPETNAKKKLKLKILYYSIAFDLKNKNLFSKNILASKVSTFILTFYIYIFLFLIFISCYLGFYHRGVALLHKPTSKGLFSNIILI